MKPAFALDFRNDAIALLHRTTGGWHLVGSVTVDDPDLPAALGYLRSTALGLSPRGLATKLVLPDDQILLTTVEAPGPDEATRLAQIRSALEGRTPYAVADLAFDWEVVGGEVRVAVIARDTLAEAEAFASEHRFNPVAFVAAPAEGFSAEPWFGPTAQAVDLLAPGERVERDGAQVEILARSQSDEAAKPAASGILAEPVAAAAAVAPVEPGRPDAAFDASDHLPEQEPPSEDPPEPPAAPLHAPSFDLADNDSIPDATGPSEAFRGVTQAGPAAPLPADLVDDLPEDIAAPADETPADEAPMALDVEDEDTPAPPVAAKPAVPDDLPPLPGFSPSMGFASRRASADPGHGHAPKLAAPPRPTVARPAAAKPAPQPPAPKAERPMVDRPTAVNLSPPKESKGLRGLGAFVTAPGLPGGSRRKQQPPPVVAPDAPAMRPAVARPAMAGPAVTGDAVAGPVVTGPVATGPVATGPTAAPAPAEAPVSPRTAATTARPQTLEKGLGARRVPVRGKPRHLGLILTALLLLVLAVIAAWSTSLAFRSDEGAEVQVSAAELPLPEDEMLADGEDPEALADGPAAVDSAAADTTAPIPATAKDEIPPGLAAVDPAPDGEPAASPGPAGDEIVLAAKDQAPAAPAPLSPPEAVTQGDPLPLAQAPPPPFGTVYQFDTKGLIVPTPEGIVTPEGVRLVAGKPPLLPKPRPEGLVPVITPDATAPPAAETAEGAIEPVFADPALAGFRPKARPEGLSPPPVELNEDSAAPIVNDNRLAGKRPLARPEAVLVAGEAARAAAAASAASLAAQAETAAGLAPASQLAIAISRRPAARPEDLSRAVEAAVAAAIRAPDPQPEAEPQPEPEQSASLVPAISPEPRPEIEETGAAKKASSKSVPRGKDAKTEVEADDEPEAEAAVPSGTQNGSLAKQATFKNALALDKTALIGVYGTPSNRYAMIRTSGGRYKKVTIGDSIDGGRVQAITASEVRYQKGSRLVTLALPKG
ncbi:hypothetical protein [Tabrizicola oligotrophica]|uniref:Translation initiation factor 2 n=1 Tax=Tabrizicola oligotrophica TaxID=2710650 RepID=A0A6M0QPQ0_9RHOB|nr:hypothetical protein [Tabrizicola oligotrophica]NEY89407.1 hypothetical protein [Tabrizicola oligotrophica]